MYASSFYNCVGEGLFPQLFYLSYMFLRLGNGWDALALPNAVRNLFPVLAFISSCAASLSSCCLLEQVIFFRSYRECTYVFYPTGLVFYQVAQASLDCLVCGLACFQFVFSQLWDPLGFLCHYLILLDLFCFLGL